MLLLLLLHPHGNILEEVAETYRITKRLKKVEAVLGSKKGDAERVFRDHTETDGDVVVQPDVGHRENLDLLLGGLSALHIGGLHAIAANRLTEAGCERIEEVLSDKAVSPYYERYYPFAPAILVRRNLHGDLSPSFMEAWQNELASPDFVARYREFIALDQRFVAAGALGDFLALLDDYYVHGNHLSEFEYALRDLAQFRKWVTKKSSLRLLSSMQSYFDFAEDLDAFLSGLREFPIMRWHVWLHFAYWFSVGGKRMVEIAEQLKSAIERLGDAAETGTVGAVLLERLRRLADPQEYSDKLVGLFGDDFIGHKSSSSDA